MTVLWAGLYRSRSDRGGPHWSRVWMRGLRHRVSLDGVASRSQGRGGPVELSEHAAALDALRLLHKSFGASSADTPSLLLPAVGAPMFSDPRPRASSVRVAAHKAARSSP